MNKKEFISEIAEDMNKTKKETGEFVNKFLEKIEDVLAGGDKVQFMGFGTFETRERAARIGRNPKTNEEIEIPASIIPAFKPSKFFKDKVNGENGEN